MDNVNGVILLPDGWDANTYTLNSTNTADVGFNSNTITANDWQTLEDAGCVFLPAAGDREGTTVNGAGSYGLFWSASPKGDSNAYYVSFGVSLFHDHWFRSLGCSVRLVCPAEN